MANSQDDFLSFKEYPMTHDEQSGNAQINVNSPTRSQTFTSSTDEAPPVTTKAGSMFSIEFYQQFFNVDTMEVVDRIATSMIPKRAPSKYLSHLGLNPDLYGPFWIAVTLIFTIAVSGNLANYLQHANKDFHWHYNFHLVSSASICIMMYICLTPLIIWSVLKYSVTLTESAENPDESYIPSLLSLVCVYGYSLAIYIPVTILWTIQISVLQWLLVLTGAFLSGSVLISVMMDSFKQSRFSFFLVLAVCSAHFLLAAGFMLFFFHVPSESDNLPVAVAEIVKTNLSKSS